MILPVVAERIALTEPARVHRRWCRRATAGRVAENFSASSQLALLALSWLRARAAPRRRTRAGGHAKQASGGVMVGHWSRRSPGTGRGAGTCWTWTTAVGAARRRSSAGRRRSSHASRHARLRRNLLRPAVDAPSSSGATWTTIAVMLSRPPRPFASEIRACTLRSGSARDMSSICKPPVVDHAGQAVAGDEEEVADA